MPSTLTRGEVHLDDGLEGVAEGVEAAVEQLEPRVVAAVHHEPLAHRRAGVGVGAEGAGAGDELAGVPLRPNADHPHALAARRGVAEGEEEAPLRVHLKAALVHLHPVGAQRVAALAVRERRVRAAPHQRAVAGLRVDAHDLEPIALGDHRRGSRR